MVVGFVLIKVVPGKEKEVYEKIASIKEVEELYPLFGEYDMIAKVVVKSIPELSDIVVNGIRSIGGIVETKTLMGAKF